MSFDVVIIGGGVVGCAIARELARYNLKVVLVEREADVACGTSGANSGVVHSGFKEPPGSLKAEYSIEGNKRFDKLCGELGVPFERIGTLVVALEESEKAALEKYLKAAEAGGIDDAKILSEKEVRRLEPNVPAACGFLSPSGGITDPMELTIALAENAAENGVEFLFEAEVTGIEKKEGGGFIVETGKEPLEAKVVVNAAGLHAGEVAAMIGVNEFKIHPCRGEYIVVDKSLDGLVNTMVYPVPPKETGGIGVHLTPTIDGNILIGPSAQYDVGADDVSTSSTVWRELFEGAQKLVPSISRRDFINCFAGNRSKIVSHAAYKAGEAGDFVIREEKSSPGFINLVGIESPGLTAAPVIAEKVRELVSNTLELKENLKFNPIRKRGPKFSELTAEQQAKLIQQDPDYGEIICRCETVTKREVLDAINNPLGVRTLRGIKNRCRSGMGRCQGGFCLPKIIEILEELAGGKVLDASFRGTGSEYFKGEVRSESK